MAEGGSFRDEEVKVAPAAPVVAPVMDVQNALKASLRSAHFADGLAKGLHESAKALDKREAHFAVLAENCEEEMYKQLIEALCQEHSIPLMKVADKKLLGEWCGLCKYDQEGKARKVVGCSSAVVRDYGTDDAAKAVLQHYFDSKKQT